MDTARYAELFLTESREHLSAINRALLDLERAATRTDAGAAPSTSSADAQRTAIAGLFRAVHTMKGMSATMGYASVASISHEMETLLDHLRGKELAVSGELTDVLFKAADALEAAIEDAVAGRPDDPAVEQLTTRLRALGAAMAAPGRRPSATKRQRSAKKDPQPRGGARRAGRGRVAAPKRAAAARRAPRSPAVEIRLTLAAGAELRGVRATMALKCARALGEVTAVSPAESTFVVDEFGHEVVIRLVTAASAAVIVEAMERVGDVASVEVTNWPAASGSPTEASPAVLASATVRDARSVVAPAGRRSSGTGWSGRPGDATAIAAGKRPTGPARRSSNGSGNGARGGRPSGEVSGNGGGRRPAGESGDGVQRGSHVRIDLRRLDALMNLIGELVIARGRLVELTTALADPALTETMGLAARLIGDLQDEIMTCRMVPVGQVFDRFPRLVRDAARSLGKQVAFDVDGKDIELDRSMLDEIGEPIVHLLRNAVDHGIESPEAREAAGKPREGRLTLSATRDRSAVLIRVADDGRGIDRARVLARARETGLVDPGTRTLSDEEVMRLIARPGFTTAEQVTDLSGRGVGIDAVQARVRALGGSVDIKSTPGEGTLVTARLPLTLAIMRALLARVGTETYAFPMAHVDETVAAEGAALAAVRGRPVMLLRGEAIPYVRMRELVPGVGQALSETPETWVEHHVLIVEAAGRRAAVAVDELTGQQDIVVKQFDGVRGGLPLFSGATILGDGAPALIVDVGSLF